MRLTEGERELCGDAKAIRMALRVAGSFVRRVRWDVEEAESAALWGLVVAARGFDAGLPQVFEVYAVRRVWGAVVDAYRKTIPQGFRRRGQCAPSVSGLGGSGAARVAEGFEAVGTGLEFVDRVEWLAAQMDPLIGDALKVYFTRAECGGTTTGVGRVLGRSQGQASVRVARALRRAKLIMGGGRDDDGREVRGEAGDAGFDPQAGG